MIPKATLCHRTGKRLRLKISEFRGDHDYFRSVEDHFRNAGFEKVLTNPLTGSVIVENDPISVEKIAGIAKKQGLFILERSHKETEPLVKKVTVPLSEINSDLKKFSGGSLDLPVAIFLLLLSFGIIELLRGNFKMPPWYTAFWYAFGVFSKSIFDSRQKETP